MTPSAIVEMPASATAGLPSAAPKLGKVANTASLRTLVSENPSDSIASQLRARWSAELVAQTSQMDAESAKSAIESLNPHGLVSQNQPTASPADHNAASASKDLQIPQPVESRTHPGPVANGLSRHPSGHIHPPSRSFTSGNATAVSDSKPPAAKNPVAKLVPHKAAHKPDPVQTSVSKADPVKTGLTAPVAQAANVALSSPILVVALPSSRAPAGQMSRASKGSPETGTHLRSDSVLSSVDGLSLPEMSFTSPSTSLSTASFAAASSDTPRQPSMAAQSKTDAVPVGQNNRITEVFRQLDASAFQPEGLPSIAAHSSPPSPTAAPSMATEAMAVAVPTANLRTPSFERVTSVSRPPLANQTTGSLPFPGEMPNQPRPAEQAQRAPRSELVEFSATPRDESAVSSEALGHVSQDEFSMPDVSTNAQHVSSILADRTVAPASVSGAQSKAYVVARAEMIPQEQVPVMPPLKLEPTATPYGKERSGSQVSPTPNLAAPTQGSSALSSSPSSVPISSLRQADGNEAQTVDSNQHGRAVQAFDTGFATRRLVETEFVPSASTTASAKDASMQTGSVLEDLRAFPASTQEASLQGGVRQPEEMTRYDVTGPRNPSPEKPEMTRTEGAMLVRAKASSGTSAPAAAVDSVTGGHTQSAPVLASNVDHVAGVWSFENTSSKPGVSFVVPSSTRVDSENATELERNPFHAIDSPLSSGSDTKVSSMHVPESIRVLDVGYQDPALGYVELHAHLGSAGSGVHASLVAQSPDSGEVLAGHLSSLSGWMHERNTPVESLTVLAHRGEGSFGGNAAEHADDSATSRQSSRGQQDPAHGAVIQGRVRARETSVVPESSVITGSQAISGVSTGAHISLMA